MERPNLRAIISVLTACLLVGALFLAPRAAHADGAPKAADPGGTTTGVIADVPAKKAGEPTLAEVADAVGHNRVAINFMWTLFCGFLVMFMQAGFALVETGLCRAKNAAHVMAMNFFVYVVGMLAFYVCGFALQMGGIGALGTLGGAAGLDREIAVTIAGHDWGLFGFKGFFLNGVSYDVGIFAIFLFQMVFMDTTATIPTGALAERWKFISFIVFSIFIGGLIYPIYANWTWGGGWLSMLGKNVGLGHGHVDFAGSSVVHMTGGVIAFFACKMLGPRIGKFTKDGIPRPIPGHHVPMVLVGTFILAFGWFGFNAGSTLAGADLRIAVVAVNTMLAGSAGAASACLYVWLKYGKPDPTLLANGMLAGLVAITAPCAFVTAPAAVLIGLISGVLVCVSCAFMERKLKIDDPVGAISVHGVNGAWGVIALGLFADGMYGDGFNGVPGTVKGLLYGDGRQLVAQLIGVGANLVWVGLATIVCYKITSLITRGQRVSEADEIAGLDIAEVGLPGYPEFVQTGSGAGALAEEVEESRKTARVMHTASATAD